jgi:hypothetical protein
MGARAHLALRGRPHADRVVTRALLRASTLLAVSGQQMARILGVSPASWSRVVGGQRLIDPESKEGELALLFLRLVRSLDALLGGDAPKLRAWLRAPNTHLSGIPLECIGSVEGLVRVDQYLDAMRGKT